MRYAETVRTGIRGHDLFTTTYFPDKKPIVATLCFHHGLAEHVGRYREIFSHFADAGIAVVAGDAVGHGKSTGTKAYIDRFDDIVDDFESLVDWTLDWVDRGGSIEDTSAGSNDQLPNPSEQGRDTVPIFLAGQSLGGLIAALTALRQQDRYSGLLLCSPALDVEWTPMLRVQASIGGVLSALVPQARIVAAIDPVNLNKDPVKVQNYIQDPLCFKGSLPSRTGYESMLAFRKLSTLSSEFKIPLYAHHGTSDKITSLAATRYVIALSNIVFIHCILKAPLQILLIEYHMVSRRLDTCILFCNSDRSFIDAASSLDKTFIPVEGGYHEILHEDPHGHAIIHGMIDWIVSHSQDTSKL